MTSAAYSSGHVPAVSVIVPAHNDEPYIGQCIESILGQTFEDFELIVVNDGSTDNTPSIIEEYAAKDPRVRVIHTGQKSGRGAARNTGIEAARAELIAFQDADDLSVPDRLEIQKRPQRRPTRAVHPVRERPRHVPTGEPGRRGRTKTT
ncbi:MAG: glycosyltransferase family A protein [Pirellulaceae bacterium]